ncbi:bifunctional sugar-1-phosphate nucleotidylyltransferase/acetyltransferase [Candidatus Aciduliprofundum boonei]|uniref:Bifunctional protein GlmU n=1 Tax=Aciduliprofundum boonei (strain DSM 19572 / T469) TaxID=439481 RepID=D3TC06_ACIB4|nr:bifunctional sugar-1-phosphate nucleotidylyltransferase/acetyltransferase [Candidatus Aciduliprofundum boonei]ADD08091.1 Nucleotidyl transferase [Aciduliprofundum boonei T469]HII55535.1 NTP transferase domain-containing protein [Candidatus Aciduliprofundum boonei]
MRAFILAAGEGTRMWPLTDTRPKPLIPLANKPIIEHILDALVEAGIEKISILIGYEGRQIAERYGYSYKGAKIDYVYQNERRGTGDAVLYASKYNDEKFLILNGDLYFEKSAISDILGHDNAVLGVYKDNAESYGLLIGDENLEEIREKVPSSSGLVNAGVYVFHREIFEYIKRVELSPRGEIEFTDAINMFVKEHDVKIVKYNGLWLDIGYPWHLLDATKAYLEKMKCEIGGEVEENVVLKGKVCIGEGTKIMSGTYIEGPVLIGKNCKIGPNAYIRPYTVIGDDCHIGNSSEVKASIIMNGSKVPHFNYVGDSVIGENCNLGAGTKVANLRLDEKNIRVVVKDKIVDTGRRKLGVIMGDYVHTGINVSIDVGTMIGSYAAIAPGAKIKGIVSTRSRVF